MDSNELGTLRNKLLMEVKELEEKLKERREKIRAIDTVQSMLIEGSSAQTGNKPTTVDASRFKKMGLEDAILKYMSEPIRWVLAKEIGKDLLAGGLKTKAKHFHSTITATLQRLSKKKGLIEIGKTEKGRNRFKIKETAIAESNPSGNN